MPKGPPVFSIEIRNFAIVTYAVAAERVQRHLPGAYELDTVHGPDGPIAFVSATCFCNENFRLAGLGFPRHTFNESTYRTYVTHKGRKGVYFFGRYLGTRGAWMAQRPLARHTYTADFEIATIRGANGYDIYSCLALSSAGPTSFSVRASEPPQAKEPFRSGDELAQFLTYRLHGFYTDVLGAQGHMPVKHPRMDPLAGALSEGRFDLWDELGIVDAEEAQAPFSVLVVPAVPFTLYPPRFLM